MATNFTEKNPNPDIRFDLLDPGSDIVFRDKRPDEGLADYFEAFVTDRLGVSEELAKTVGKSLADMIAVTDEFNSFTLYKNINEMLNSSETLVKEMTRILSSSVGLTTSGSIQSGFGELGFGTQIGFGGYSEISE